MCSLRYTVHPEHNRRETRLPQMSSIQTKPLNLLCVGGIGAAGRDCFGIVQAMNNRAAHSPDCPLDRFPVSPCPEHNRRETRLPQGSHKAPTRLPQGWVTIYPPLKPAILSPFILRGSLRGSQAASGHTGGSILLTELLL
jgi:hypothetical protein